MGGAIKAVTGAFKSLTNVVQSLAGGALKNLLGNIFNIAGGLTKALSPIAPKFFGNLDKKLQSFQPKVMGAIDKGLAFMNKVSNAGMNVAASLQQTVQSFTPMGNLLKGMQ